MFGIFGQIDNPLNILAPGKYPAGGEGQGLVILLTAVFRMLVVIGALYTTINIILSGYQFLSAGGDPKAIAKAWEKIWQSIMGLIIIAGSIVLALIIGYLIFGPANASILIAPKVFTP